MVGFLRVHAEEEVKTVVRWWVVRNRQSVWDSPNSRLASISWPGSRQNVLVWPTITEA